MELPFLEISIVSTTEQTLTDIDILQQIGQAFTDIFLRDFHIYQQAGKNILKIEFESLTDFEQLYAGSLRVHEYLFGHIVHEDLNFDFIKEASMKNNTDIDTFVVENYLVLIYISFKLLTTNED